MSFRVTCEPPGANTTSVKLYTSLIRTDCDNGSHARTTAHIVTARSLDAAGME